MRSYLCVTRQGKHDKNMFFQKRVQEKRAANNIQHLKIKLDLLFFHVFSTNGEYGTLVSSIFRKNQIAF